MPDFVIEKAEPKDYPGILELQKLCFRSEAEIYSVCSVDPMKESLEQITAFPGVIYRIMSGSRLIGSGRVKLTGGSAEIGRLVVHPDFQNKGLGHRILAACELTYPEADFFELFTGEKSVRNLHLYEKNGYIRQGIKFKDGEINIVALKKANSRKLRISFDPSAIKSHADYKLLWKALPRIKLECVSGTDDCRHKPGDVLYYANPYEKPAEFCEALSRVVDVYAWRIALGFPSWNPEDHGAYVLHCPDSPGTVWKLVAEYDKTAIPESKNQ